MTDGPNAGKDAAAAVRFQQIFEESGKHPLFPALTLVIALAGFFEDKLRPYRIELAVVFLISALWLGWTRLPLESRRRLGQRALAGPAFIGVILFAVMRVLWFLILACFVAFMFGSVVSVVLLMLGGEKLGAQLFDRFGFGSFLILGVAGILVFCLASACIAAYSSRRKGSK